MSASHVATLETREAMSAIRGRARTATPFMAAALLIASLALPYWHMTLYAPQYPGGLRARVYLTRATGDIQEISNLNHYVGLTGLEWLAPTERRLAIPVVLVTAGALLAPTSIRRLRLMLRLPMLLFPVGVAADLAYWLWRFGHTLDPSAPIRIDPFMPALLGRGTVMQFTTASFFGIGFGLALGAAVLAAYDLRAGARAR